MLAAAEEAIFFWRNMVESNGAARRWRRWRRRTARRSPGTAARRRCRAGRRASGGVGRGTGPPADTDALLAALARRSGRRVRVFDLTAPEVGVPVVKAVLG